MLKQRIITAIVLLAVLLTALVVPTPWPLLVLISVFASCAAWEWLRLCSGTRGRKFAFPLALALGVFLMLLSAQLISGMPQSWALHILTFMRQVIVPVVAVLWIFGASTAILRANTEESLYHVSLSVFGLAAVVALWISIIQLFLAYGPWFLVSMLALIWFADSSAYFAGKAWGKHKLAPRVSPGKTWEGALGGVIGALAWMLVSAWWGSSFSAVLIERWGAFLMVLMTIFLVMLSIIGDLFESLLKRRAGVKDSSQLLPGHGGVFDRIDALFPVAPVALLLAGI